MSTCSTRNNLQLRYVGEKYGYQSSISKLMKNHLYKIYKSLKKFVENNSFVLDIGSNDGTFKFF